MFNQRETQHTIGAHYRQRPPQATGAPFLASNHLPAERHLDRARSSDCGAAPSVRMANASTNTPRRLLASSMGAAPAPAAAAMTMDDGPTTPLLVTANNSSQDLGGSYSSGGGGPQHYSSQLALSQQQPPAQPKKRGPKVGSRRTRVAPTGSAEALDVIASKPQHQRQASSGQQQQQSGWQHDPLPAPVAKCNATDARTVRGASSSGSSNVAAQQHDPYAFQCDSAAAGGASYLDNGGNLHLEGSPMGARRQPINQTRRRQQQQQEVNASDRCHLFDDNHQQGRDIVRFQRDISRIEQGATTNNKGDTLREEQHQNSNPSTAKHHTQQANHREQQASGRMIAHHQKQAHHQQQTQVQMQSIQQQQRNPITTNNTTTATTTTTTSTNSNATIHHNNHHHVPQPQLHQHHHHHHQQQPPQTQTHGHHLPGQPQVVLHQHQDPPPTAASAHEAPLNNHHQQQQLPPHHQQLHHHHPLHSNHQQQQTNSEQQQFNAGNYYNHADNEPQYQTQPLEATHQQRATGQQQMYQQQPGDGMQPATTIMVPNHQQTARFVPGNNGNGNGNGNSNSNHGGQYQQQTTAQPMQPHHNHLAQQHTTTSSTGSTPSQAYMTTAPGHTSHQHQHQRAPHQQGPPQQQLPMQHAASFPLAGPAPDLPPNQQTLTQVPRASHLPPHHHHTHHHHPHHHQQPHNHHHHPQQQQQLPPPPVVDPMDRVMQQQQDRIAPVQQQPAPAYGGPTGQHIPVRPNATAPDQNRLASSQQQQQQRHQIPIRPTALGVPVDHFNGEPEMPTMQAGGGAGSAGTYSMGPTNLLQQQLNRRPGGPPGGAQQSPTVQPPIQMQRQQPQIMKQPPRSSFQPASSQMQQQQLPGTNNDLYQQFPPHQMGGPQQQQQRALPPAAQTSKQPVRGPQQQQQAIRQQVINQAPIQMDNANHHHNQQHHQHHHHQQQQQHLLCNPTPPLTPNAMPPMATAQQLHQHNHLHHPLPHHHHQQQQRLQQQPDEWQPQSHSHPHQQHNLEPISEQPHLPLQPPGANFANGPISPSTAQLKQHQMRPGPGTMRPTTLTPTTAGAATTRPSVATAAAGPVHPQQINEPTMAPQMMGPMNQFGQHVPPVPSNMGATQGSSHKVMGPQQQQQAPSPATSQHHFQINNSANSHHHHHHNHQQQQQQLNGCVTGQIVAPGNAQQQLISQPNDSKLVTRLSLPLRDGNLLGPFKLEHGVQYARKVFHINAQLMETLSKSSVLAQQQQPAAVVQELQFRAYLSGGGGAKSLNSGDSLLAPPSQQASVNKACQWPELFQVSINQQPVHLDRSSKLADDGSGQQQLQHKALDVFQYCHLGENLIEFQVNDCYCSHEFVLELVDRPTLKAFMDSCFKSRLLPHDSCLQRLKFNFGSPGFVPVKLAPEAGQLLQSAGIQSDYVSEIIQIRQPNGQQVEQQVTQVRISLRCPLSARRMRAPTRGPNCKHLQCFDLENFLHANRDQILWSCPICSQPIPFNMLELDQFQMSILQSMSHHLDTDDIVVDASGQWKAYYAATTNTGPPSTLPGQLPGGAVSGFNLQELMVMQQQAQQTTNSNTNTMVTKTNGTFHPQISSNAQPSLGASPISSPMRPLSGNGARPTPPLNHHGHHNHQQQATSWPQHEPQQPHHNQDQTGGAHNPRVSPVRRPPSAISGQATPPNTGRRSTPGPIAKRPYSSQRSPAAQQQRPPSVGNQSPHGHQAQLMVASQAVHASNYFNTTGSANSDGNNNSGNNTEELSPLAAMERAIIQHEQQMGPPPFDPNSLTSSPLRSSATNAPAPATSTINIVSNQQQQQQQQVQSVASPSRSTHSHQASVPASPLASQQNSRQSPQIITQTNISTPATPLIHHIGPETPATPGSNQPAQQQQQQQQASNPTFPQMSSGGGGPSVDHQPLSNGSASAGSITSSSTMTPSGQSLGSVGMGGDSRCNTAPLQGAQSGSLDGDLITSDGLTLGGNIVGGGGSNSGGMSNGPNSMGQSGGRNSHLSGQHNQLQDSGQHHQDLLMGTFEDKNEILMSKLMMDSADSDSMLHRNNELAFALEEAQWKQQLDRGKSEHLANFLNDPLMMSQSSRKHHHHHHLSDTHTGSQYHHHNQMEGANKMLSGGLNPSDDESANNSPRDSSPGGGQGAGHHTGNTNNQTNSGHSLDQPLDPFVANYLDSGSVDDGAGLPPDDSILDLFER